MNDEEIQYEEYQTFISKGDQWIRMAEYDSIEDRTETILQRLPLLFEKECGMTVTKVAYYSYDENFYL